MTEASSPEVLVVAEPADGGARAAWRLASAGTVPSSSVLLTGEELVTACWSHAVAPDGATRTTIVTGRGVRIDAEQLRLVWFRASTWRHWGVAAPDADYARAEVTALLVSWLGSLGDRVVNRVDGMSAVGPSWSQPRWLAVAASTGLPVAPWTAATSARIVEGWRGSPWDARRPYDTRRSAPDQGSAVLVAGHTVVGVEDALRQARGDDPRGGLDQRTVSLSTGAAARFAERYRAECLALADAGGCRLLRIALDEAGRASGADPCPPLTTDAEIVAAAGLLRVVASRAGRAA